MTTLFLGAGFSKWAFDLPLVSQLFDFKISPTNEQESGKLELLIEDWESWNTENPSAAPEQFINWCLCRSSHRRSRIIWYVARRLTEPFMTRILGSDSAAMFDERVVRENEQVIKIRDFLLSILHYNLRGILTCNYDTIVECALGTFQFNYGNHGEQLRGRGLNSMFPWQNAHVSVTGKIPLVKLHGSLSWDGNFKYTSGKPGREGRALIVPPAPEKVPPYELRDVWALGAKILKESESIIVFGFAFNPYDIALLEFLTKNGSRLKRVLLIDPFPDINRARLIWPSSDIETLDPRNHFELSNHHWFSE